MKGFRTSRALIIDDEIQEAIPVVHALGLLGIGSVYHDADPKRDYTLKHAGVHLLVLDMVLGERVSDENDPKNVAAGVIGALKDLLDPSPGIVVAICWTKHPDNIEEFKKLFKSEFPQIQLAEVLVYEKKDLQNPDTVTKVAEAIRDALDRNEPSNLLIGWQQLVHEATTRTLTSICGLATTYAQTESKDWGSGAYAICAALALAERGSRLIAEQPHISLHGLNDALGPLLLDRIEHSDADVSEVAAKRLVDTAALEIELWKESKSLLTTELRAILNAQVNVSYSVSGDVCPGNVYLTPWKSDNREFIKHHFSEWPELIADTFFFKDGEKRQLPGHFPVLVEITPPCDFAQGKGKLPRFAAGFLIPENSQAELRSDTAYVRQLLMFEMDVKAVKDINDGKDIKGVYTLAVNSHYLVSIPHSTASKMIPSFRLRSAITSEVVAWLGAHMTRPGFVQLVPGAVRNVQTKRIVEEWSI